MRVIAVINKKGGVSKTTTTANIGHALALQGHRVTLIDFDPQGHLSVYLGAREMSGAGVDDVLLGTTDLKTVSIRIRENLTLIQPGKKLDYIEQLLDSRLQVSKRLKRSIDELASENDYLLIDCPPSSGLLAIFALYSCHQVLIPVNGDYLSLHGVSQFLDTLKSVEKAIGHDIDFQLAMTRYYPRRRLA
ncbi:MAG: AAA family ATPase, partial [Chromatiales bacterium]|nr:AAA family ATPase [Chromatiales bacterium]